MPNILLHRGNGYKPYLVYSIQARSYSLEPVKPAGVYLTMSASNEQKH